MTHYSQLNLIMLATVIGLAVFLYLTPQFQSENDEEFQISLRTPESVRSIRVIRHGSEFALQRVAGNWHLTMPFSARADEELVAKMLNVLSADSRQRFPLTSKENFNLDRPSIELYIDDDYFAFGGLAPTTHDQYLAINEHVYLVSPRYAVWMPAKALDLVSMRLLREDELPVKFELEGMSIQRQGGLWQVVSGDSGNQVPYESLARWVELWQDNLAPEVVTERQDDSSIRAMIKISLQDGREVNVKVLNAESGALFFRDDEQVGYFFPEAQSRQLLNPFVTKAD